MLTKTEYAAKHEPRLRAFDKLMELRRNTDLSRKELFETIHNEFGISLACIYEWYWGLCEPEGRRGKILFVPELFYVLGALLGDGCLFLWKTTCNYVILVGDEKFATKYADAATRCLGRRVKAYPERAHNVRVVRANNFELYSLFKKIREQPAYMRGLLKQCDMRSALLFVEGFFDAEGCVKIIKEPVRITPKICLDITNTNFELLEFVRIALKERLGIEARYSSQEAYIAKDGHPRKKSYHLRIYRKEFVKKFLETITTTKLKEEKTAYVNNWLNNGL